MMRLFLISMVMLVLFFLIDVRETMATGHSSWSRNIRRCIVERQEYNKDDVVMVKVYRCIRDNKTYESSREINRVSGVDGDNNYCDVNRNYDTTTTEYNPYPNYNPDDYVRDGKMMGCDAGLAWRLNNQGYWSCN